ncbi:BON domain-containing protein [Microvirga roseola]|uniref:BON domain-containing protein n=1 Tax=Microvirga roseola TaxID=2883126 RepID=UPI001E46A4B1|nr:BON domain-containing protein [Microvirga roseola]
MADDRYRTDRDHYRDRDEDGYIARRGFGNRTSGYDRGSDRRYGGEGRSGEDDRYVMDRGSDYGRRRERDFGDSAGYGTGGSTRDWRDVVGEDPDRGADWGYPRPGWSSYDRSREQGSYGSDRDRDRYETGYFGRGSRDYSEEDRGFFERAGDELRAWLGDPRAERRREQDMQVGEFRHRGRGPKGYQRSDERIQEDVNDRLTDDPHLDASEIEVSVSNREVTLNGTVNSRFEKRHAEDLADSVSGVTHVQNNLRIQQPADAGIAGSAMSGAGAAGAGTTETPDLGTRTTRRRTSSTSGT